MPGRSRKNPLRRLRLRPLWLRFGVSLVALLGVGSLAAGWHLHRQQQSYLLDERMANLRLTASALAGRYADVLRTGGDDELRRAVHSDSASLRLGINVSRTAGGRFASDRPGATDDAGDRPLRAWVRRDGLLVEVMQSRGELVGRGQELTRQTLAIAAAMVLLAAAAGLVLATHLSRRIAEIARGAARFASGNLRHRIRRPPSSELANLADALNDMAAQLSARIAELRAQRNETEAVLRSMEGGVIAIDAEQRVVRLNRIAARMLHLSEADVRGERLQDVIRRGELSSFAADAIADPTPRQREFDLADGVSVRATSGALLDAEDEPIGAIILLTDVTQLKHLQSVRSDFAANVSHELRTPITNIKGYVETLLEGADEDRARGTRFLEIVSRNADRLGAIVDDMLVLTNLERTDGRELPRAPTGVRAMLDSARGQLAAEAQTRGITVLVDAPADLKANINPRLGEQAVMNLLSNAVKYSGPVTVVTLRGEPAALPDGSPAVAIEVEDEGPGIPPEHLARIFERFYRVDKARSRAAGGTGLGLSIVKHIALVHGGEVTCVSEVGRGTVFRLLLPAARAAETPQPAATPEGAPRAAHDGGVQVH